MCVCVCVLLTNANNISTVLLLATAAPPPFFVIGLWWWREEEEKEEEEDATRKRGASLLALMNWFVFSFAIHRHIGRHFFQHEQSRNGVGAFQHNTTQHSAACLPVCLLQSADETARCVYLTFEQALERLRRRRLCRCRLSVEI